VQLIALGKSLQSMYFLAMGNLPEQIVRSLLSFTNVCNPRQRVVPCGADALPRLATAAVLLAGTLYVFAAVWSIAYLPLPDSLAGFSSRLDLATAAAILAVCLICDCSGERV